MPGKFQFTLQQYQDAAIKWRKDLLMLPIHGINDTLKYMTGRPGIRYKEMVGTMTSDAQFAPYKYDRNSDANLNLEFRELETFFGNVVTNFEPNSAVSTLLGTGATKGDGQMSVPTAKHVLALQAKALSEHLNSAIWNAKRNASGDTTADLFNGFDTITKSEVDAGNISATKGNYDKYTETITASNVVDWVKDILFNLNEWLRADDLYMYCSQTLVDLYNEGYQLSHGAIPYNTQYGQNAVEGSNGKLHFVPLANKTDSKYIQICNKSNMLVGYDQMGDMESIQVDRFSPFLLTYSATMFFGVNYECIDPRRLKIIEIGTPLSKASNFTRTTTSEEEGE